MKKVQVTNSIIDLFAYTPTQYMVKAMMAGTAPYECFTDDEQTPALCLILEGHSLFVAGDPSHPFADEAMDFLSRDLLCTQKQRELEVIKIIFPNDTWKQKITKALDGIQINEYQRSILLCPVAVGKEGSSLPHIQTITPAMKNFENFSMIQEEVESTLGSVEQFLSEGFGTALVLNNRVCGFCTAEYISPGICAIGIAVEEEYRQRGFASQMADAFAKESAARGLMTYWDCWKNNVPSYKTAVQAGFTLVSDYPVLFVHFLQGH